MLTRCVRSGNARSRPEYFRNFLLILPVKSAVVRSVFRTRQPPVHQSLLAITIARATARYTLLQSEEDVPPVLQRDWCHALVARSRKNGVTETLLDARLNGERCESCAGLGTASSGVPTTSLCSAASQLSESGASSSASKRSRHVATSPEVRRRQSGEAPQQIVPTNS